MPKETTKDHAILGPDRERDEFFEVNASPYVSNIRTSYQGEVFCWLDHVEEDDCVLTEVYSEKKVLAPESWSQNHDASFENCWEYNVHGSFGNQPDYGLKGLLPE